MQGRNDPSEVSTASAAPEEEAIPSGQQQQRSAGQVPPSYAATEFHRSSPLDTDSLSSGTETGEQTSADQQEQTLQDVFARRPRLHREEPDLLQTPAQDSDGGDHTSSDRDGESGSCSEQHTIGHTNAPIQNPTPSDHPHSSSSTPSHPIQPDSLAPTSTLPGLPPPSPTAFGGVPSSATSSPDQHTPASTTSQASSTEDEPATLANSPTHSAASGGGSSAATTTPSEHAQGSHTSMEEHGSAAPQNPQDTNMHGPFMQPPEEGEPPWTDW